MRLLNGRIAPPPEWSHDGQSSEQFAAHLRRYGLSLKSAIVVAEFLLEHPFTAARGHG